MFALRMLMTALLLVCLFLKFLYDRDPTLLWELFFSPPPMDTYAMHRG